MIRTVEQSAMRKVYLRVLPFAVLTYFFCYLDRINVGFAALTMNKDLGLDPAMYGMAAGAFFWGYVLFEVPSNIILEKLGARLWIARIMVTWGHHLRRHRLCHRPLQLYGDPFSAGGRRSRAVSRLCALFHLLVPGCAPRPDQSGFILALPIAVATGAPVSTALLGLERISRAARLAGHVHFRGDPGRADRHRRVLLPDRPAERGELAQPPTSRAGSTARSPANAARSRPSTVLACCSSFFDPKSVAAVAELSRHRHRQPRPAAVPAANHQAARRHQYAGRLADHDPLYLRRHQLGAVRHGSRTGSATAAGACSRPA